jgi:hypothetical protein
LLLDEPNRLPMEEPLLLLLDDPEYPLVLDDLPMLREKDFPEKPPDLKEPPLAYTLLQLETSNTAASKNKKILFFTSFPPLCSVQY